MPEKNNVPATFAVVVDAKTKTTPINQKTLTFKIPTSGERSKCALSFFFNSKKKKLSKFITAQN